tara:strand:+ start:354 stop:554 length:201 start_codon:yes stop_codon:yes gene_type:complete
MFATVEKNFVLNLELIITKIFNVSNYLTALYWRADRYLYKYQYKKQKGENKNEKITNRKTYENYYR